MLPTTNASHAHWVFMVVEKRGWGCASDSLSGDHIGKFVAPAFDQLRSNAHQLKVRTWKIPTRKNEERDAMGWIAWVFEKCRRQSLARDNERSNNRLTRSASKRTTIQMAIEATNQLLVFIIKHMSSCRLLPSSSYTTKDH